MRPRPSAPVAIEVYLPTSPALSSVAVVAEVQARSLQWATFRLSLVPSK